MKYLWTFLSLVALLAPSGAFAMRADLQAVYDRRPDLRAAFDELGESRFETAAGFLMHFEDWAYQYGWRTEPELAAFAPEVSPPRLVGASPEPVIDAAAWIIVDKNSGQILRANNAEKDWPIASITKLVTADVVTKQTAALEKSWDVRDTDNVGGARLYTDDGTRFTVRQLMYATLVASANNAANATSRVLGVPKASFVNYMNDRVRTMGLRRTALVDPTGIEVENTSTAREVAFLAREVFGENELVRKMTQTVRVEMRGSDDVDRSLMTTNWMLYKPAYDNVWVTAGKTGFLYESEWNVVEQLRPSQYEADKELIVVVFGSHSRGESFDNVLTLSEWTWANYLWE